MSWVRACLDACMTFPACPALSLDSHSVLFRGANEWNTGVKHTVCHFPFQSFGVSVCNKVRKVYNRANGIFPCLFSTLIVFQMQEVQTLLFFGPCYSRMLFPLPQRSCYIPVCLFKLGWNLRSAPLEFDEFSQSFSLWALYPLQILLQSSPHFILDRYETPSSANAMEVLKVENMDGLRIPFPNAWNQMCFDFLNTSNLHNEILQGKPQV